MHVHTFACTRFSEHTNTYIFTQIQLRIRGGATTAGQDTHLRVLSEVIECAK